MNSNYNKVPMYCRLAEIIEEQINDGTLKKGQPIPSERDLCKQYNVSRITVRSAIDELVRQGKLEKIQGKGTFILSKSIVQNLGNVYSFSKEMEKQGKISSTKIVTREKIKAEPKIAYNLGLNENDDVIYIERLRCAENVPIMVEKAYFPYQGFEFLMELDFCERGLYKTLEEDYHIVFNKAIETFKACELNTHECKMLNCPKNQYGLLVKRTSYSNDKIACYSTIVSKGDSFEFTVKLVS